MGHIFKFNCTDIDVTTEYKNLGCVFQNKFAFLKEHKHCLTKIIKIHFQSTKLFSSNVSAGNKLDLIDSFHGKYIKRVLKLRPQTPTLNVLGVVGEYSI